MKIVIFIITVLLSYGWAKAQNIGIGTTAPNPSAALEIKASNKGLLVPRTSTATRISIVNPAKGLMVYDTTTSGFWFYNGSSWNELSPGNGTNDWTQSSGNIYNNNVGNVGIGTPIPSYKLHVIGVGLFTNTLIVADGGFDANNTSGYGIYSTGTSAGVFGSGITYGVSGYSSHTNGSGVYGYGLGSRSSGVYGTGNNYGVYAKGANAGLVSIGVNNGIEASATNGAGVYSTGPTAVWGEGSDIGVVGNVGNTTGRTGVSGSGPNFGVVGTTSGATDALQPTKAGVYGYNNNYGGGVWGYCVNGPGIIGTSINYYAGYFNGNVYSSGTYTPSDRKLKTNIVDFASAMDIINKLRPKTYQYRQDGIYNSMNLPAGNHFGLISEDVEQVLPYLVKETKFNSLMTQPDVKVHPVPPSIKNIAETKMSPALTVKTELKVGEFIDFKAVNYTEIIPIIIKGMQEQQQQIQQLKQTVIDLKNILAKIVPSGLRL